MKKLSIIALTLVFSFSWILPALAEEINITTSGGNITVTAEGATVKNDIKNKAAKVVKFARRAVVINADLKEIKSKTDLVVMVKSVTPKKGKKWTGFHPEAKKDLIIKVSDKTKFVKKYLGKSSFEDLTVGDSLQIVGKTNEDGTVTAALVKNNSLQLTLKVYTGLIESIDAANNSFVLKQPKANITVVINAKTKVIVPGIANPTIANLAAGNKVHLRGIINKKTKMIDATVVRVIPVFPDTATPTSTPTITQ